MKQMHISQNSATQPTKYPNMTHRRAMGMQDYTGALRMTTHDGYRVS